MIVYALWVILISLIVIKVFSLYINEFKNLTIKDGVWICFLAFFVAISYYNF